MFPRQANSSPLSYLPFDILEDITDHLSRRDLCNLMLASRECSHLAVRALYSLIPLHTSSDHIYDLRPYHTLRRRQFSFLIAISQHPEYTRFIRRIAFEFTSQEDEPSDFNHPVPVELVWRTFAKCTGVVYIDIKAHHKLSIDAPKVGLFPNLRRARVSGPFSPQTLAQLLNTSPSIHALELSVAPARDSSLGVDQALLPRVVQTPSPFDDLKSGFQALKTLNVQIQRQTSLMSLTPFLQRVRKHVTFLILKFPGPPSDSEPPVEVEDEERRWASWIPEALSGFVALEELWLKGVTLDSVSNQKLKERLPELKSVKVLAKSVSRCSDGLDMDFLNVVHSN